jgi:hypothetical protein
LEATADAPGGRSGGVKHKNFFIAKTCDSESARAHFSRASQQAQSACRFRAHQTSIKESPAAQAFLAFFANSDRENSCSHRIVSRASCEVASRTALRALAFPRQHFLKREAVFVRVLVYSGCRASRSPSARNVEQPTHLSEGTMAKKAKKAKKAKSAVKKTAKKTRKVAKKKK